MNDIVQNHVTTNYGGVAAILLAIYIGMTVYRGNISPLMQSLAGEMGFLKWAIALIVVWVIIQESGPGLGSAIALLAFGALALTVGSKVFPQIQQFFKGT